MKKQWVLLRSNDAKDGEFSDYGKVAWVVPPNIPLTPEQGLALFGTDARPSLHRAKAYPRVISHYGNDQYRIMESRPEDGWFLELVDEELADNRKDGILHTPRPDMQLRDYIQAQVATFATTATSPSSRQVWFDIDGHFVDNTGSRI